MAVAAAGKLNISRFSHMDISNTKWMTEQHQSLDEGSGDDRMMSVYDQPYYLADSRSEEDEEDTVFIDQNLDMEQRNYEFPSKALLVELAAVLDTHAHGNTMFDESSFTTLGDNDYDDDVFDEYVGSIVSSIQQRKEQKRHHTPSPILSSSSSSRSSLIDDDRLSPLELPPHADKTSLYRHRRTERPELITPNGLPPPVHPSFFLRQEDEGDNDTYPDDADLDWDQSSVLSYCDTLDLPVFFSESVPIMDDGDTDDEDEDTGSFMSHVRHPSIVVIRLSKKTAGPFRAASSAYQYGGNDANTHHLHPEYRVPKAAPWCHDDEGYNDEGTAKYDDEDEGVELESVSKFLPLTTEELAGMSDQDVILRNIAVRKIQACWRGYQARKKQKKGLGGLVSGLANICTRLHRRQMTRMTERLDILQRRIEEERAMRIGFEKAMEEMTAVIDKQQTMLFDRMEQMQIEHDRRIANESQKRLALEESMNLVLLEMQEMQRQQQRRANDEAAQTRALQNKLDMALEQLKKTALPQQQRSTTPSSHLLSSSSVRTGTRRPPRTQITSSILDRPSASPFRSIATTQRRRA